MNRLNCHCTNATLFFIVTVKHFWYSHSHHRDVRTEKKVTHRNKSFCFCAYGFWEFLFWLDHTRYECRRRRLMRWKIARAIQKRRKTLIHTEQKRIYLTVYLCDSHVQWAYPPALNSIVCLEWRFNTVNHLPSLLQVYVTCVLTTCSFHNE